MVPTRFYKVRRIIRSVVAKLAMHLTFRCRVAVISCWAAGRTLTVLTEWACLHRMMRCAETTTLKGVGPARDRGRPVLAAIVAVTKPALARNSFLWLCVTAYQCGYEHQRSRTVADVNLPRC